MVGERPEPLLGGKPLYALAVLGVERLCRQHLAGGEGAKVCCGYGAWHLGYSFSGLGSRIGQLPVRSSYIGITQVMPPSVGCEKGKCRRQVRQGSGWLK